MYTPVAQRTGTASTKSYVPVADREEKPKLPTLPGLPSLLGPFDVGGFGGATTEAIASPETERLARMTPIGILQELGKKSFEAQDELATIQKKLAVGITDPELGRKIRTGEELTEEDMAKIESVPYVGFDVGALERIGPRIAKVLKNAVESKASQKIINKIIKFGDELAEGLSKKFGDDVAEQVILKGDKKLARNALKIGQSVLDEAGIKPVQKAYVPVAERVAPVVSKDLEPLAQEARKSKLVGKDSADRVKEALRIPTDQLASKADYVEPYGTKGAKTYGFYVDENNPLTITVGKNGEKISHGYDYNKIAPALTSDSLAAEARKYKSAEEFVKAQESKYLYHGTNKTNLESIKEQGIVPQRRGVTSLSTSEDYSKNWSDNPWTGTKGEMFRVKKDFLEGKITPSKSGVLTDKQFEKLIKETIPPSQIEVKTADGWKSLVGDKLSPSKSQLTDFYNQAIKATPETTLGKVSGEATIPQATPLQEAQAISQKPPVDTGKAPLQPTKLETTSLPDNIAQKSSVVNSGKESQKLTNATYESNRANKGDGIIAKTVSSFKAGLNSIKEGTDKILGAISSRLQDIDPSLKTAIRKYEFNLANNVQKDRKAVEPFLKLSRKIDKLDYADLDLALKNGDITKTREILSKYGLEDEFNKIRETLDDLYKRAEDVGYDIGYEKNYFPRTIQDSEGMLDYLQKGDDWSLIDEAIKAKETELGRYLTTKEKANTVNTLIRGFPQGRITLSETGAMKARRIDIVDAELNKFYHDSISSLLRYIDDTNEAIEARKFFGKGNKTDAFANIDDSIGAYVLDLLTKGKIKPSQERELREILHARFNQIGTSGIVRTYKNLSYIDTMGSFISAITQLGDLAFSIYKGGPLRTIKSFAKALVGKSEITKADIGIEKIAQEFQDGSLLSKAVSKVFKLIGLEKLDTLGKEAVINSTIGKFRKLAEEPTTDFLKKLELIFGDDPKVIAKAIDDLNAGRVTEDVKLIAFNELLDVQPVALSEMPEQYLKGGNGRIFYMLKTYTIKLYDVYRNEVVREIAQGNVVKGIKNLVYLTGSLVAANATADEIKDLLLDRETSLTDRTVDNLLKLAGFSKFTVYKAREEGIGSAVAKTILPPFKFIDAAYKDIAQGNEISQLETIQSIPLAGKLYYWWFGKGATKTEKKRAKESSRPALRSLPGLPALPGLPKLPTLPGLPALR